MAGQDNKKVNGDGEVTNNETDPSIETNDENVSEEYELLDSKLDELNSVLDILEQKNDDIQEKLKELLQSNMDIRQELRNENMQQNK